MRAATRVVGLTAIIILLAGCDVPPPGEPAADESPVPITYVDDAPTAWIDGESVTFIHEFAIWGYFDPSHPWHEAQGRYRAYLEHFHPGGSGLNGTVAGRARHAPDAPAHGIETPASGTYDPDVHRVRVAERPASPFSPVAEAPTWHPPEHTDSRAEPRAAPLRFRTDVMAVWDQPSGFAPAHSNGFSPAMPAAAHAQSTPRSRSETRKDEHHH